MKNGVGISALLLLSAIIIFSGINQEAFGMSVENKLLLNQGLDEIQSHINASKDLFEQGHFLMAISHLGHPIEEVYDTLPLSHITNKNFVDKLELSLFILKNTSPDILSEDYFSQLLVIENTLQEGKNIVFSNNLDSSLISLQTAVYLLDLAKVEYSEGMNQGGTLANNIEIQDSYAFTEKAYIIIQNLESVHQKNEIFEKHFTDLDVAYDNAESSEIVGAIIDEIILEINQVEIQSSDSILPELDTSEIPEWIKNIALWWATGQVNDGEFIQAIEFLINQGTITVSNK
jgi:hypothetical protein